MDIWMAPTLTAMCSITTKQNLFGEKGEAFEENHCQPLSTVLSCAESHRCFRTQSGSIFIPYSQYGMSNIVVLKICIDLDYIIPQISVLAKSQVMSSNLKSLLLLVLGKQWWTEDGSV